MKTKAKQKKPSPSSLREGSIRVNTKVLEKVAKRKEKTGIPIGRFFEQAAIEKLDSDLVKEKVIKTIIPAEPKIIIPEREEQVSL